MKSNYNKMKIYYTVLFILLSIMPLVVYFLDDYPIKPDDHDEEVVGGILISIIVFDGLLSMYTLEAKLLEFLHDIILILKVSVSLYMGIREAIRSHPQDDTVHDITIGVNLIGLIMALVAGTELQMNRAHYKQLEEYKKKRAQRFG